MPQPLSWEQIKAGIDALPSTKDIPVEKYAEENGWADSFVQQIRNKEKELKATQLRRFFSRVKQIQHQVDIEGTFDRVQVLALMPALAWAKGRKLIPVEFYDLMKICFGSEKCQTKEDFLASVYFLEAIMAYHKYRNSEKDGAR